MPTYHPQAFSTILNVRKSIDPWFWDHYSLNPYSGCSFGCVYCDARSDKYHLPLDFEEKIGLKTDAAEMLDKKIAKSRTLMPDVVAFSGVTDPYQPAEHSHRITRACLEVLRKHKYPVHIITKSKLVGEDLELISEIGKQTWAAVSFSIPTVHPVWSRFLDKNAPTPELRLKTLAEFREKAPHVHAGVLMIPIVPGMGNDEADLRATFAAAKEAGASYLLASPGMTLRDNQARWFFQNLEKQHPDRIPEFLKLYHASWSGGQYYGSYAPDRAWQVRTMRIITQLRAEFGIPDAIPRFIPTDWRAENYSMAETLFAHGRHLRNLSQPHQPWDQAAQAIQLAPNRLGDLIATEVLAKMPEIAPEIANWVIERYKQE